MTPELRQAVIKLLLASKAVLEAEDARVLVDDEQFRANRLRDALEFFRAW